MYKESRQAPPQLGGSEMEKKTIGKFISALRRANGMTQKELGERLFVSDKTISRWECDECTPDLSLIPAIAEIFEITTDELLHGERNNQLGERMEDEASQAKRKGKSEKQFKTMLHGRLVKYQNLSMISVGIAFVGLIVAMICNLGFQRGILGFCVGCIFFITSVIFQICAVTSKLIPFMEEDEKQIVEIKKANTQIIKWAVSVMLFVVGSLGFLFPLLLLSDGGYTGVTAGAWFCTGALSAFALVLLAYAVYVFGVRENLMQKEKLYVEDADLQWMCTDRKLLKKMLSIALSIACVLALVIVVLDNLDVHMFVKPVVFETIPEFQEYMLENRNHHFEDGMDIVISQSPVEENLADENVNESVGEIKEGATWSQALDREGNVLFSYAAGDFYYLIKSDAVDGVPIEVYLKSDRAQVYAICNLAMVVLGVMIVIEFFGCMIFYARKTWKMKNV